MTATPLPADLRDVLEALPLALVGVDADGRIRFANREAATLLGYEHEQLLGNAVEMLVPEASRARHAALRAAFQRAPRTRLMGESLELSARRRDGTTFPVAVSLKVLHSDHGDLVLAGIVDLSAQKALEQHLREQFALMEQRVAERTAQLQQRTRQMEAVLQTLEQARAELERLSRHDPLTGLPNRREFDERAGREASRAARRHRPICVAMLDLDHFKAVNDRFGHGVGDRVLRRIAAIFQAQLRRDDVVARYGGEEFVVLLPETALDESTTVVERVRVAVGSEAWGDLQPGLAVTLSGGLAQMGEGEPIDATVHRADGLLYRAKHEGRNRIVVEPRELAAVC